MKFLFALFLLFGCQQDEMTFRTVRRVNSVNIPQIESKVVKSTSKECNAPCTPPAYCDHNDGVCKGMSNGSNVSPNSSLRDLKLLNGDLKPESSVVFDVRTGRMYR